MMTYKEALNVLLTGEWYNALPKRYVCNGCFEADELLNALNLAYEALELVISLPEEHGALIDRDRLLNQLSVSPYECPGCPEPEWMQEFVDLLDTAEVVLPATKPKSENISQLDE